MVGRKDERWCEPKRRGTPGRMPVPQFTNEGVLPPGMHECTLDEVARALGWSGRRRVLIARLRDYAGVLCAAWGSVSIILDGSFVSSVDEPNDIDVVVLINELGLGGAAPRPDQATSIRRPWVNKQYSEEIDLQVAADDGLAAHWTTFFSEVKGRPGVLKGLVRVSL